jgi:hypothetical protein
MFNGKEHVKDMVLAIERTFIRRNNWGIHEQFKLIYLKTSNNKTTPST